MKYIFLRKKKKRKEKGNYVATTSIIALLYELDKLDRNSFPVICLFCPLIITKIKPWHSSYLPRVHRPSLPRVPIRLVSRGKKARANTRPESPLTNESNLLPDKSSPLRIHPLASLPLFSRLCCSSLCRLNITHSSPYLGFHLPLHCLLLQGFLFFPSSPHRSSLGPPPGGSPVRSPSPPKSGAWRSWSRTRKPAWR